MSENISNLNENTIVLYFPVQGWNTSTPYSEQMPLTTPLLLNCRLRDQAEKRIRGGQRDGRVKAYDTQVSVDMPVVEMTNIVVTYIPPVA